MADEKQRHEIQQARAQIAAAEQRIADLELDAKMGEMSINGGMSNVKTRAALEIETSTLSTLRTDLAAREKLFAIFLACQNVR